MPRGDGRQRVARAAPALLRGVRRRARRTAAPLRLPFDAAMCEAVEEIRPEVVSFHFGLPDPQSARAREGDRRDRHRQRDDRRGSALARARAASMRSSPRASRRAATPGASWASDPAEAMGLFALLPQVVDAVSVPVIAAGGIADGRGIAAALMLGASAVQLGTAYLHSPEDADQRGASRRPEGRAGRCSPTSSPAASRAACAAG